MGSQATAAADADEWSSAQAVQVAAISACSEWALAHHSAVPQELMSRSERTQARRPHPQTSLSPGLGQHAHTHDAMGSQATAAAGFSRSLRRM